MKDLEQIDKIIQDWIKSGNENTTHCAQLIIESLQTEVSTTPENQTEVSDEEIEKAVENIYDEQYNKYQKDHGIIKASIMAAMRDKEFFKKGIEWLRSKTVDRTNNPKDYPEHFHEENGCYQNRCMKCNALFLGRKNFPMCKECMNEKTVDSWVSVEERFKVGQNVKMWDVCDQCNVFGIIVAIEKDLIKIKWDDIESECEHYSDEWKAIKILPNPPKEVE